MTLTNMKFKIFILASYFVVLFLFTRVFDLAMMVWSGGYMIESTFIEHKKLSVPSIKSILDSRGVDYYSALEKKEFLHLLKSTGNVTTEELQEVFSATSYKPSSDVVYDMSSYFFNENRDTMGTACLVRVNPIHKGYFPESVWADLKHKLSLVGIPTAVFDCETDRRFCEAKKWTAPRLVLTIPHNSKYTLLHEYEHTSTVQVHNVLRWVNDHLSKYVTVIASNLILDHWLSNQPVTDLPTTRVILFSSSSQTPQPPLFLSSLAVHFFERVAFGVASSRLPVPKELGFSSSDGSVYVVLTPETKLIYGRKRSETFNFQSMQQYLCTFVPKANDAFLWSLALVNAFVVIDLLFHLTLTLRSVLAYSLCVLIVYNGGLFLAWLCVAKLPLGFLEGIYSSSLRYVSSSCLGCLLRSDYKHLYTLEYMVMTFLVFAVAVTYLLKKYRLVEVGERTSLESWYSTLDFRNRFRPPPQIRAEWVEIPPNFPQSWLPLLRRLESANSLAATVVDMGRLPSWTHRGDTDEDTEGEDQRDKFNEEDWHRPRNKFKMRECAICLKSFDLGERLCSLPCFHIYHFDCLRDWLERGQRQHCPVCRR